MLLAGPSTSSPPAHNPSSWEGESLRNAPTPYLQHRVGVPPHSSMSSVINQGKWQAATLPNIWESARWLRVGDQVGSLSHLALVTLDVCTVRPPPQQGTNISITSIRALSDIAPGPRPHGSASDHPRLDPSPERHLHGVARAPSGSAPLGWFFVAHISGFHY
jgi:hypothetical protein